MMMMTSCRPVYLVGFSVFASALAQTGYIMNTNNNLYLDCTTKECSFQATPTQVFERVDPGGDQWQWRILSNDGTDSGQCLDREHCHTSTSNTRMSSCSHCGAIHWQYDESKGMLAEDHNKNCIQDDGRVKHCSESHATLKFVPHKCTVKSQVITDLTCKDKKTGGICGASFSPGSTVAGHDVTDCNACNASSVKSLTCQFKFDVESSSTISSSFDSATTIGLKVGATFTENALVFQSEESIEFSISSTLKYGHDKIQSQVSTISSACTTQIAPGTRETMEANVLTGTLVGEFTATVKTTHDQKECPDDEKKNVDGKITITNVPTQSVVGSCTPVDQPCDSSEEKLLI